MAYEIRALEREEIEQHADLVYASYAHGREFDPNSSLDRMLSRKDWWLRAISSMPSYRPEQTRVMVMDGKLVSSVTCYPRPSYIAGRVAKASCLGSVCTHPDYRRRGLLRHVLEEAIEWMSAQGDLWSFLYGLEAVYGGSGWRHLTSWSVVAHLEARPGLDTGLVERPASSPADVEELARLYSEFNSRRTGPTVRSSDDWEKKALGGSESAAFRLLTKAGRTVGYYLGDQGHIEELAWSGAPDDVLGFLLERWPGSDLVLPLCDAEMLSALRDLAAIAGQDKWREDTGSVKLTERDQGLWRYHGDPEGVFPEFNDTEGLLRFLRRNDYVMWPSDRA